ncbi:MAG: hypothetical protein KJO55_07740 [Gammaproteobacteria bacterium]|nr:hypothetical protein [Gammaproteobacteria bacterium]
MLRTRSMNRNNLRFTELVYALASQPRLPGMTPTTRSGAEPDTTGVVIEALLRTIRDQQIDSR